MKVLIVASGNSNETTAFIRDQVRALTENSVEIDFFLIKGRGLAGYANNYIPLLDKVKKFDPDLIHAHYGLSGLLSVFQRKVPIVVTFHGSDINDNKERFFSKFAHYFSDKSIFVSKQLAIKAKVNNPIVIPCGIDMDVFYPRDKNEMRQKFGMDLEKKYILFSSSFNNSVKNYPLAKKAVSSLKHFDVELIELKGFTREEVALLMNAVDLVLLTSFTEGSPQFIKEALASNTPIVSTDVGDVKDLIRNTDGCYLTLSEVNEVSNNIKSAIEFNKKTNGRNNVLELDNKKIVNRIIDIYKSILN